MSDRENPHTGHRKRVRKRFTDEGLESFSDHEILELLLFYSVPRRDTNETAHRLILRFGSLSSVFDAGIGELTDVEGISLNTAVLIKLIPALSRAYLLDRDTRYPSFRDPEKLGRYLVNSFIGCTGERLIAVYFNNRGECIGKTVVSEGTVNSTDIPVRKIAETGYRMKAAYFVLAHNHPDGDPIPSAEDISATETCTEIFCRLGIPLAEHYVIGGNSCRRIISADE